MVSYQCDKGVACVMAKLNRTILFLGICNGRHHTFKQIIQKPNIYVQKFAYNVIFYNNPLPFMQHHCAIVRLVTELPWKDPFSCSSINQFFFFYMRTLSYDTAEKSPTQGLYSLSCKTSYRKISWSLEAARFVFRLFQSLWNLTTISATMLSRCLSNFRTIR